MSKCPPKNNCNNCDNAAQEEDGIECLLYGWFFKTYVAKKSTCDLHKPIPPLVGTESE